MPVSLESLFDRLKNWFPRTGAEIEARASKLEAQLTQNDEETQSLPRQKKQHLREQLETRSSPASHRAAVRSALDAGLESWQADRSMTNSVVILASPIEPLERIWEDVLETWDGKAHYQVRVLQLDRRPQDCAEIPSLLREQLVPADESHDDDKRGDRPEIIVIPHLEWYFLRSVEGLDGIEYLQQSILENPDRFWAIGCNSWAWQYLDCVCQGGAYCDRTLLLPELEPIEIKDWLATISDDISDDIKFGDDATEDLDDPENWNDRQEDWQSRAELVYFDKLQTTARGLSRVAVELWLASLCVQADSSQEEEDKSQEEEVYPQARQERIDLPDRPFLSIADRYLIYSVLLHGRISLHHLALSLGEPEPPIRAQVRVLMRSGALWNRQGTIQVNPAYYLRLKTDLENNKFLVSEDNADE